MTESNPFPTVTLVSQSGSSATVSLYGGMVTSWKVDPQEELLFTSSQVQYKAGKAIRGGIPVIFPQFLNMGPLPSHGFARTEMWQVECSSKDSVTLLLTDTPESRGVWPEKFRLFQTITLDERMLKLEYKIENCGTEPFCFQFALHTYLRVGDIQRVGVEPFDGCSYLDNLENRSLKLEGQRSVKTVGETDRIYLSPRQPIVLRDDATKRTITLESKGLPDLVLWNPWIEKSKGIADLGDMDYLNFICLEAAAIKNPLVASPGSPAVFSQQLYA